MNLLPPHACLAINQLVHLADGGVQEVWQRQQPQRVAGRRGVEDDAAEARVLGGAQEGHHLGDGHHLVHPRGQSVQQLACTVVKAGWVSPGYLTANPCLIAELSWRVRTAWSLSTLPLAAVRHGSLSFRSCSWSAKAPSPTDDRNCCVFVFPRSSSAAATACTTVERCLAGMDLPAGSAMLTAKQSHCKVHIWGKAAGWSAPYNRTVASGHTLMSARARSTSTSMPHSGRSMPSTATGAPPLTS